MQKVQTFSPWKKGKKSRLYTYIFWGKREKNLSTAKLIKRGTTKIFHSGCLTPRGHYDVMLWLIQTLGLALFLCCVTIFQCFFLQWCNMQVWRRMGYPEIGLLMFWLKIMSDILRCCFYVELCSVLRLVVLCHLQLSHMDHGPTLEKSHVLWGNPYAPGDVELTLVEVRGLPAAEDMLFYDI